MKGYRDDLRVSPRNTKRSSFPESSSQSGSCDWRGTMSILKKALGGAIEEPNSSISSYASPYHMFEPDR